MTDPNAPTADSALAALDRRAAELATASGETFEDLLAQLEGAADGRNVVKGEDLRGVPFIITLARFQPGKGGDFVSLESVAAPQTVLDRAVQQGRTHAATAAFLPVVGNERFVLNDSSTGIRRQVVKWLNDTGKITINPDWDFTTAGKADVLDQPYRDKAGNPVWLAGADLAENGIPMRYLAARGTRISEYDYQGDIARTVYLA